MSLITAVSDAVTCIFITMKKQPGKSNNKTQLSTGSNETHANTRAIQPRKISYAPHTAKEFYYTRVISQGIYHTRPIQPRQ